MKKTNLSACRSLAVVLCAGMALLTANPANAANQTIKWTLPTTWNDGTPLATSEIVGENVYCGPTSGAYDTLRSALGAATQIKFDATTEKFCVVTVIATKAAGTIDVYTAESDYSVETVLRRLRPGGAKEVISENKVPATCTITTVCKGAW